MVLAAAAGSGLLVSFIDLGLAELSLGAKQPIPARQRQAAATRTAPLLPCPARRCSPENLPRNYPGRKARLISSSYRRHIKLSKLIICKYLRLYGAGRRELSARGTVLDNSCLMFLSNYWLKIGSLNKARAPSSCDTLAKA
jgi:hypothetical protein